MPDPGVGPSACRFAHHREAASSFLGHRSGPPARGI